MFGVVAYFCPFVFTQKPPPPAAVIDFLCKARIQNFLINSISVRRAVERDCQTRACSNLTNRPVVIVDINLGVFGAVPLQKTKVIVLFALV